MVCISTTSYGELDISGTDDSIYHSHMALAGGYPIPSVNDHNIEIYVMKLLIINGPNLNLLGTREPGIYGSRSFESYLRELREMLEGEDVEYLQSNHEGDIIDFLHNADCDGIILNAGAYTHTSLAIADAISAIKIPVIEVHISNVASRETIRHTSLIAPVCRGTITGFGLNSYFLAAQAFIMGHVNR